jgi:hypothetical protein
MSRQGGTGALLERLTKFRAFGEQEFTGLSPRAKNKPTATLVLAL